MAFQEMKKNIIICARAESEAFDRKLDESGELPPRGLAPDSSWRKACLGRKKADLASRAGDPNLKVSAWLEIGGFLEGELTLDAKLMAPSKRVSGLN